MRLTGKGNRVKHSKVRLTNITLRFPDAPVVRLLKFLSVKPKLAPTNQRVSTEVGIQEIPVQGLMTKQTA